MSSDVGRAEAPDMVRVVLVKYCRDLVKRLSIGALQKYLSTLYTLAMETMRSAWWSVRSKTLDKRQIRVACDIILISNTYPLKKPLRTRLISASSVSVL
jgi:hypothetical protein